MTTTSENTAEKELASLGEADLRECFDQAVQFNLCPSGPHDALCVVFGNRLLCSGNRQVLWQKFKIAVRAENN